jgi:hypothetical protein
MNLWYCAIVISSLILNGYIYAQLVLPPNNLDEYDAYGSLLVINENVAIIAQNDQEQFTIITHPFSNRSNKCDLPYYTIEHNLNSTTRFVYNMAIGTEENASQITFSYIYENWKRDVFLTVVFLEFTDTGCVRAVNQTAVNMTDLNMKEHALVGMDPYGKRAYAVGTDYIVCIEVQTDNIWQLKIEELFDNQDNVGNLFFPKALVVNEDHYIFAVGQRFNNLQFIPHLLVLNFQSPPNVTLCSFTNLSTFNFGPSSIDITRYSTMSISLLDEVQQFIIGIPHLDMLIFLSWDRTNISKKPITVRTHVSPQRGIFFGKSVALLDNNTFAVLAHTLPTLPWSTSQVQVSQAF